MIDWSKYEDELIRYAFQKIWNQKWRGVDIPKHIYKSFLSGVTVISDQFTSERRSLNSDYMSKPKGRYGYMLYFHLASVQRNLAVFEEIKRRNLIVQPIERVLDFGSGLGSASWALFMAMQEGDFSNSINLVASDLSKKTLDEMSQLLPIVLKEKSKALKVNFEPKIWDARDPRTASQFSKEKPFDLILCSNMVNEICESSKNHAIKLLKMFMRRLTDHGMIVIV
ncbi:MAG: class I SAM-dependent methyltransferase, partial [Bdellovibrionales bacterium]|nr:class I SAM-dependent methyltransferase [Bdellovibrionales bacterium]